MGSFPQKKSFAVDRGDWGERTSVKNGFVWQKRDVRAWRDLAAVGIAIARSVGFGIMRESIARLFYLVKLAQGGLVPFVSMRLDEHVLPEDAPSWRDSIPLYPRLQQQV